MKSFIKFCLLFFVLFITVTTVAQKDPMKYGKVEMSDLLMTEYLPDPDAPAVVICSYGTFDSENFLFTHHLRVKIFKKEGYNLASRKFATPNKYQVRGKTFNLVDGEIVEEKLKNESIFVEKITDNRYYINVAMPNVKEGSIIDLEVSYNGFPSDWYFQENIPVQYAELRIDQPRFLKFRKNSFGYHEFSYFDESRWVIENVPAFNAEPYMDSRENYIQKFEFDIISYMIPGYDYEDLASNWEEVSETLMQSKYFGLLLKTSSEINKKAKEIDETYTSQKDKLIAAIDYLHQVDYNGEERCFAAETSFNLRLKEKTGNSADINLMLIKMLQKMDFTVYPLALSTKDNGYLSPVHSSIRKLNYVVAYVEVDSIYYAVDATEKLLPFYMLPERCLNWRGRLIDEKFTKWVYLDPQKKEKEFVYYDLALEDDLSLTGKLSNRRTDYAAFNFRKEMEKYNSTDEYLEALTDEHHGLSITNADIKYLDSVYYSVIEEYEVVITDKLIEMDSTLYLQLTLFEQNEENPFKAKERSYPVDFSVPIEKAGVIKIKLPDHIVVQELPKPAKIILPNEDASFVYSTSYMNNTVMLQYKLNVNKTLFVLDEYENLKAFYNEIIKKEAEPLVLTVKGNHEL